MKNIKNKVIMCVSFTTLLFTGVINAGAQKAEIGFRFMPTFTSFDMKTSAGGTVKGEVTLGYGVGAFVGFNFSDHFGIQAEVIYSSISQKYKELDVERKVNLKYVNIPLLLSLNTGKTKPVNLNVVAGPQIGYNIGSSVQTTGGDGTYNTQAVLKVKKSDIGFAYGAGLDFGLNTVSNIRLGLGFRGVIGLIDISDNEKSVTNESYYILDRTHIKTNSVYIGISFLI